MLSEPDILRLVEENLGAGMYNDVCEVLAEYGHILEGDVVRHIKKLLASVKLPPRPLAVAVERWR